MSAMTPRSRGGSPPSRGGSPASSGALVPGGEDAGELLVERVFRVVECVPAGRVVTYGMVAAIVGTGPRQVGAVMARDGGAVPWWRVVNARGALPDALTPRAEDLWSQEGTARVDGGGRVDLRRACVDEDAWQRSCEEALRDLPDLH